MQTTTKLEASKTPFYEDKQRKVKDAIVKGNNLQAEGRGFESLSSHNQKPS